MKQKSSMEQIDNCSDINYIKIDIFTASIVKYLIMKYYLLIKMIYSILFKWFT